MKKKTLKARQMTVSRLARVVCAEVADVEKLLEQGVVEPGSSPGLINVDATLAGLLWPRVLVNGWADLWAELAEDGGE